MKPKTVGRVRGGNLIPTHAHTLCHGVPVGLAVITAEGERAVESLAPGDPVVSRNGMAQVSAIRRLALNTHAVRFAAGCFGAAAPAADLILPAGQPVLVRDWLARAMFAQTQAMTTAAAMVDDANITKAGVRRMELVRVEFDRPRVIYVAGMELGTEPLVTAPNRAVA